MSSQYKPVEWRCFDRDSEINNAIRTRPHWQQNVLVFITFRLADSMPKRVVQSWLDGKRDWLTNRGFTSQQADALILDAQSQLWDSIPQDVQREFRHAGLKAWNLELDRCHGSCVLRDPVLAQIVHDAILFLDGQRYDVERFVVMPNHVHLLVQMYHGVDMRHEVENLLRFTARRINQLTQSKGKLWQSEPFDHLVRSNEQFEYLRDYIANNPTSAGLRPSEYLLWIRPPPIVPPLSER